MSEQGTSFETKAIKLLMSNLAKQPPKQIVVERPQIVVEEKP